MKRGAPRPPAKPSAKPPVDGASGRTGPRASRRRGPARALALAAEPVPELTETPPAPAEAVPEVVEEPLPLSVVEPVFAARVPPPLPERPRPVFRRAVFLDVENTSRAQHLAHVIDHLALDHATWQTELVAVANWRVVGHEAARLVAQKGAHLVHSAPSTGVRDWSDLRIAVAAGLWLASARPGDAIEIVSDDRAFDAVGDVAASLGITFQRLSYRRLVKEEAPEIAPPTPSPASRGEARGDGSGGEGRGRRRRRRGGRDRRGPGGRPPSEARPAARYETPPPPPRSRLPVESRDSRREPVVPMVEDREARHQPAPAAVSVSSRPLGQLPYPPPSFRAASRSGSPEVEPARTEPEVFEPHTAPHDEIVSVVRELVEHSADRRVSIDTLANALKARGFRRPPGSPRLMTRLRRIREIVVGQTGMITVASLSGAASPTSPTSHGNGLDARVEELGAGESGFEAEPAGVLGGFPDDDSGDEAEDAVGNVKEEGAGSDDGTGRTEAASGAPSGPGRRRRRRRRGGRGRRPPVSAAPSA